MHGSGSLSIGLAVFGGEGLPPPPPPARANRAAMNTTLISYIIDVVLRLSFLNFLLEGKRIMPYAHGFWAHRVAYFLRKCRVPLIAGYTRGGCRGRRPSGENARPMLAIASYFPGECHVGPDHHPLSGPASGASGARQSMVIRPDMAFVREV